MNFWNNLKKEAKYWASGKFFLFRALLIIYFFYVFIRHLFNSEYSSLFGGINLGLHELGHLVFLPFGEFISVFGGSFFQIFIPLISFWLFYKQEDYFALSISSCWLSTSLFSLSLYISDARSQNLPLISPFGSEEIIHDWNYLLGKMGLLQLDGFFSFIVRLFAIFFMCSGILWGTWLLKFMIFKSNPK
jgi:hypothetical protein